MKKIRVLLSLTLAVLLSVTVLASCGTVPPAVEDNTGGTAVTYISLRINPEIEVLADEEGEVIAAGAVNQDGEVVLSDLELTGMTVEEAGAAFADKALELGYIDVEAEEATVYIDVENSDGQVSEELEKKLSERIGRYFENKGVNGKVKPETLEEHAEQLNAWGLSVGQTKMVLRILDLFPEMTEEEVLAMTPDEWMELLHSSAEKGHMAIGLKEGFKEAVNQLRDRHNKGTNLSDEEIEAIKARLASEELTDEERAALETELSEKLALLEEQKKAFRDEVNALRDSFKEKSEEARDACKAVAEEKRKENADKLKRHEEKIKQQISEITDWLVPGEDDSCPVEPMPPENGKHPEKPDEDGSRPEFPEPPIDEDGTRPEFPEPPIDEDGTRPEFPEPPVDEEGRPVRPEPPVENGTTVAEPETTAEEISAE